MPSQGYTYPTPVYPTPVYPTPCVPVWSCRDPNDGTEVDGCGGSRVNPTCLPRWFQAVGGDVHSNANVTGVTIPAGAYFNQNVVNQIGIVSGFGVVSGSGTFNFSAARTNARSWQITGYPVGVTLFTSPSAFDFTYFWDKYHSQVKSGNVISGNSLNTGSFNSLNINNNDPTFVAVQATGNVSIDSPINVQANQFLAVFISAADGSPVNLAVNQRVSLGPNGFIVWIVSGDVTIANSVSQADGYWIISGKFSDGTSTSRLNISGGVVAYGERYTPAVGFDLTNRRNTTTSDPSEVITFNPNIYRFAPLFGETIFSWQEATP